MNLRHPLRTLVCALSVSVFVAGCGDTVKPVPAPKELTKIDSTVTLHTLWDRGIGSLGRDHAQYSLSPALADGVVYSINAKGHLMAMDASTGKVQWESDLHVPVSTGVAVDSGRLFVGTKKGEVIAANLSDGSIVWRTNVGSELLATPQLNSNLVVVQTTDGTLLALDKLSGDRRWLYASQQPPLTLRNTGTPRTVDPVTFAGFANGQIALFDNNNGNMMWNARVSVPRGTNDIQQMTDIVGQPVLTQDGRLYVNGYNGELLAISVHNGQQLWSKPESGYHTPLLVGNTLFVVDSLNHIHAFDAMSGDQLWEQDALEGRNLTSPVFVDGQLAFGDFEGYVHLLNAETGKLDGRDDLGGDGIQIAPISTDNQLYVLTNDGKLVAYQLSGE